MEGEMMPKVPPSPKPFKTSSKTQAIYCFPKGTSGANQQHDIEQINKFIDYVKAKKRAKRSAQQEAYKKATPMEV
jgi:hypothetical protein